MFLGSTKYKSVVFQIDKTYLNKNDEYKIGLKEGDEKLSQALKISEGALKTEEFVLSATMKEDGEYQAKFSSLSLFLGLLLPKLLALLLTLPAILLTLPALLLTLPALLRALFNQIRLNFRRRCWIWIILFNARWASV